MAMVTEQVVGNPREIDDTPSPFWESVKGMFSTGSEYAEADEETLRYERRIWDDRIERFLDSSLPDYLREFGVLDEIALHVRDERLANASLRSHELVTFVKYLDDEIALQEERLSAVEKAARKKA